MTAARRSGDRGRCCPCRCGRSRGTPGLEGPAEDRAVEAAGPVGARSGLLRLTTDDGAWVLPTHRAAWVGGRRAPLQRDCRHGHANGVLRRRGQPLLAGGTRILTVTPLAREVITLLCDRAPWYDTDERAAACCTVLRDSLADLGIPALRLPRPSSAACRAAVHAVEADVGAPWSTGELADRVGVSRRTLERSFRHETGLGVRQWITRCRLLGSLEPLVAGEPIGRIAVEVGYASQSAFSAAFKREFGLSPGAYVSARTDMPRYAAGVGAHGVVEPSSDPGLA